MRLYKTLNAQLKIRHAYQSPFGSIILTRDPLGANQQPRGYQDKCPGSPLALAPWHTNVKRVCQELNYLFVVVT